MSRDRSHRVVVVAGAGPGGLAAAARLRDVAGDQLEVVLVAPGARATFLAGTLDVLLGDAEPDAFMAPVELAGVRCVDAAVDAVRSEGVVVGGSLLAADAVIAAPGLSLVEDVLASWPGVASAWDPVGAVRARRSLPDVTAGRVVVAVCSLPYRCPPAPFALAIRLAERHFNAGHMTRVTVVTPEPMPLAGVGGEAPAFLMDACAAAGVEVERGFAVDLEASDSRVLRSLDGRELGHDALFLVPPHARAACLRDLPGDGPLVPVGPRGSVEGTTLHVAGDAAATGLPRSAGVARGMAVLAADGVLEGLGIAPAPPPPPIDASCFLHHSGGAVSRIRVKFELGPDGGPEPVSSRVDIDSPSHDLGRAREGERRRFLAAAGGG
jgi:sulfide:quinone oxidoreductase